MQFLVRAGSTRTCISTHTHTFWILLTFSSPAQRQSCNLLFFPPLPSSIPNLNTGPHGSSLRRSLFHASKAVRFFLVKYTHRPIVEVDLVEEKDQGHLGVDKMLAQREGEEAN